MFQSCLDHFVVTAPTLPRGIAYLEDILGVKLQPGGQHPRMGTHNYLLKLGEFIYLEVIAINPFASAAERTRWFGLDTLAEDASPRLRTWVLRSNDISADVAKAPSWFGVIEPMQRGDLQWLISIPPDGSLPLGGACPTLLQWQSEPHPATRLAEQGCSILSLEVHHPEVETLEHVMRSIGFTDQIVLFKASKPEKSGLVLHLRTPRGNCILSTH